MRKPALKIKETILLIINSELKLRMEIQWGRCSKILKYLTKLHVWYARQSIQKECGRGHSGSLWNVGCNVESRLSAIC